MNEELQKNLADIVASIHKSVAAAADFSIAQMSDIAQSYVLYGRFFSLVVIGLMLPIAYALWRLGKYAFFSEEIDQYGMWPDSRVWASIVSVGASIVFALMFSYALKEAALVWLAPKVWLIERIASLLK
jgi:hypothetical protein